LLENKRAIDKFYARARDPEKPPVCNIAAVQQAVSLIFLKQDKSSYKQQCEKKLNDYTDRQQQTTTVLNKQERKRREEKERNTKKPFFLP
jgi:hypothetical protein